MKPHTFGIIVPLLAILAGCNSTGTPDLIVTKAVVNLPPQSIMSCGVTQLPNKFSTDKEVANFLVKDRVALLKCRNNLASVNDYLIKEKAIVESK
jgi:hypothetical protein